MIRLTTLFLAIGLAALLAVAACSAQESADTVASTANKELDENAETAASQAAETAQKATQAVDNAAAQTREQAKKKDSLTRIDKNPAAHLGEPKQDAGKDDKPMTQASTAADAAVTATLIAKGDRAFRPGKDYVLLSPAKRTSSPPEKIELTEVFMYQCPHCFSFEPFIDSVLKNKPPQVNFVRLPAIFNPVAKLHAQAYYAAKSLGVWEQLHMPLFQEIHGNRNLMPTEAKLLDFVEGQGIERESFQKALKSFEVDSKVRDALDLNSAYRIDSVPALVVNGKYVTSGSMAGSTDRLKEIVDYLIAKESVAL